MHFQHSIGSGDGVDGIVDQVGPNLVDLAGEHFDQRHLRVKILDHLDAFFLELVLEHDHRAADAFVQVAGLQVLALVHVGIHFDGAHQTPDSICRLPNFLYEPLHTQGAFNPPHHGAELFSVECGFHGFGIFKVQAKVEEGFGDIVGIVYVVVFKPVQQFIFTIFPLQQAQLFDGALTGFGKEDFVQRIGFFGRHPHGDDRLEAFGRLMQTLVQLIGTAYQGSGGIVEFVRQTRR